SKAASKLPASNDSASSLSPYFFPFALLGGHTGAGDTSGKGRHLRLKEARTFSRSIFLRDGIAGFSHGFRGVMVTDTFGAGILPSFMSRLCSSRSRFQQESNCSSECSPKVVRQNSHVLPCINSRAFALIFSPAIRERAT